MRDLIPLRILVFEGVRYEKKYTEYLYIPLLPIFLGAIVAAIVFVVLKDRYGAHSDQYSLRQFDYPVGDWSDDMLPGWGRTGWHLCPV